MVLFTTNFWGGSDGNRASPNMSLNLHSLIVIGTPVEVSSLEQKLPENSDDNGSEAENSEAIYWPESGK
jgi:hypothetical protein